MRTPARPHWLCAAAIAAYASWPAVMTVYWEGVLKAGVLPPDGDTVMIPIMNGFIMTAELSPVFVLVLWASLRHYHGWVPIFAKPIGTAGWAWTLFYAVAAAWTIASSIMVLHFHLSGLLAVHALFALAVIVCLRSAAVGRYYFAAMPATTGIL